MCNKSYWVPIINELKNFYHVIVFDFPGHGDSPPPPTRASLDQYSELTVELMNHLNIKSCSIVGHSMGGMVAQIIASKHPMRISNLVLLATISKDSNDNLISRKLVDRANQVGWNNSLREYVASWFSDTELSENIDWMMNNILDGDHQVASDLTYEFSQFDSTSILKDITTETLIISCSLDSSARLNQVEYFQIGIKNIEIEIMDNIGHFPMLEDPLSLSRILMKFLNIQSTI